MNELFFTCHIAICIAFLFVALRLGKGALIAFTALQGVLANLFVVKQTVLFGFCVTCSDVFVIGSILGLNLIQEYFGKNEAKRAVYVSFLALVFFACMSQLHLLYAPAPSDGTQIAFQQILSSSIRIVLASITTFYLVQQFDVRFFGLLKGRLFIRVAISLSVSQLLDTTLFSFLGLYGMVESVFDIIVLSFFIKCIVIAISSPFTAFSKRIVKHELPV